MKRVWHKRNRFCLPYKLRFLLDCVTVGVEINMI